MQCDGSKAEDVDGDEDDDGNEGWIEDGRTQGYFFVLNPGGVEYEDMERSRAREY